MPTQTRPRRSSTQSHGRFNRSAQSQGRFNRSAAAGRRSSSAAGRRRPTMPRRRQSQPSGLKKLVGGLLPAAAGKKAVQKGAGNKGKVGGLGALLAAGAGLAYKNREKLSGLRKGNRTATPTTGATTVPPVTTDTHGGH